jgi:uncharacterized protein YecE (DUF72 family)
MPNPANTRAEVFEPHRAGKDVYVYFNNDGHGHAVRNATTLRAMLP